MFKYKIDQSSQIYKKKNNAVNILCITSQKQKEKKEISLRDLPGVIIYQ